MGGTELVKSEASKREGIYDMAIGSRKRRAGGLRKAGDRAGGIRKGKEVQTKVAKKDWLVRESFGRQNRSDKELLEKVVDFPYGPVVWLNYLMDSDFQQ